MVSKIKKIFKRSAKSVKADEELGFNGINKEIEGNNRIYNSTFGRNTYYTYNTIIYNADFANFCSIGPNSVIGFGDHPTRELSTSPAIYYNETLFSKEEIRQKEKINYSRVTIGNDVWIGANVFLKNGIKVGNGAVIGSGAIVLKDVNDYEIVVGCPAKCVKKRFTEDIISLLIELKWWDFEDNELHVLRPIIENPAVEEIQAIIQKYKKN